MADDTSKVLIEPHEEEAEAEDDGTDESNLIYTLKMILSGTARLNVLLPTATILAPLLTNDGHCKGLHRWLMASFVGLCAASCIFFAFTDSFRSGPSGRMYYGVATFRGIWTFGGRRKAPLSYESNRDYRLRWSDLFHAVLSLVAFLTFAASHNDVVGCYNPAVPRNVTNMVQLVVGFVVSTLFVAFPSKRRGIGHPRDSIYLRR